MDMKNTMTTSHDNIDTEPSEISLEAAKAVRGGAAFIFLIPFMNGLRLGFAFGVPARLAYEYDRRIRK